MFVSEQQRTPGAPKSVASDERRADIVGLVRRQGFVSIEALAQRFAVTPQTVRRDINALCDQAILKRHHGGAAMASSVENLAYPDRQILCVAEKRRIAGLLARHIPDHASLFLNIGTTTEEVAKALLGHHGLRVITNNLHVAALLSQKPDFQVIIAGGQVRSRDRGIIGEAAVDLIRQFRVDFGVIGISGIDLDGTLLDFDYQEVRVAQAIIASSRQVLLAADHTKFGRNALVRLGGVEEVDALFTDAAPPEALRQRFEAAEVALHVAPADVG